MIEGLIWSIISNIVLGFIEKYKWNIPETQKSLEKDIEKIWLEMMHEFWTLQAKIPSMENWRDLASIMLWKNPELLIWEKASIEEVKKTNLSDSILGFTFDQIKKEEEFGEFLANAEAKVKSLAFQMKKQIKSYWSSRNNPNLLIKEKDILINFIKDNINIIKSLFVHLVRNAIGPMYNNNLNKEEENTLFKEVIKNPSINIEEYIEVFDRFFTKIIDRITTQ